MTPYGTDATAVFASLARQETVLEARRDRFTAAMDAAIAADDGAAYEHAEEAHDAAAGELADIKERMEDFNEYGETER